MFNHAKSVGCIFSLLHRLVGFVFLGNLASFGAVFPDINSLALEIQRIASINFRVSARLVRLAQSEV
ncbi:hypothetical protein IF132_21815 [Vibrio navarrensis]|uniref:hypothetical protein n=1 Tax=Vibrio navarrensis TaxID=29495 RepID=UPI0018A66ABC|nr:hypothetical protein IF132_21815 [Vibrio navarrensis]